LFKKVDSVSGFPR